MADLWWLWFAILFPPWIYMVIRCASMGWYKSKCDSYGTFAAQIIVALREFEKYKEELNEEKRQRSEKKHDARQGAEEG